MDKFNLAENLCNVLDDLKTIGGCPVLRAEYDEFDGSIGFVVKDNGKAKRFIIQVEEV